MQIIKGHRTRVWATVAVAACVTALLVLALWQTVWAIVEEEPIWEGGDAPASVNHSPPLPGAPMTAYPPGGPPGHTCCMLIPVGLYAITAP